MNDLRTAAQQALEALQWHYRQGHSNTLGGFRLKIDEKALRELRAALAQQAEGGGNLPPPLQAEPVEPVAWINALKDAFFEGFTSVATYNDTLLNSPEEAWGNYKPPRAAPPQRLPLTEEEIMHIGMTHQSLRQVVRAVERAHGIKEN